MHSQLLHFNIPNVEQPVHLYPEIFRLSDPVQKQKLAFLLQSTHLFTYDKIEDQVKELIKIRHPEKKLTAREISEHVEKEFNGQTKDDYGVWVYYPWSHKLVHILDENDFIDIRTNRNLYKINRAERDLLFTKKVGIIGLSVGQSIAMTLATERTFGELRIADFDTLDLSNLNRLRTGIHNIGISKVTILAREIAELDPFLKVTCFFDGITKDNIDAFFLEGGPLDVLIDECDSLDIKILSRYKARELKIPVIMETSDKGLIDIERFDLEPDRPILHGLIKEMDPSALEGLSDEEKIPYLIPMVGLETMSPRLKASAIEVSNSISTWPQLASAVTLGGAVGADVYRRLSLNQFTDSGRYFVDISDTIKNKTIGVPDSNLPINSLLSKENILNSYKSFKYLNNENQISPEHNLIESIIYASSLAPSGGNSQPWQWLYIQGNLLLYFNEGVSSYLDYNSMPSFLSLGACLENAILKAESFNLKVSLELFPKSEILAPVAWIKFYDTKNHQIEKTILSGLAEQIELRCTHRKLTPRRLLGEKNIEYLHQIINTQEGATLQIIESEEGLKELGEICGVCDKWRLMNFKSHHDFVHSEMRWSKSEAEEKKDGMDVNSLELSASEFAGINLVKDYEAMKYLNEIQGGRGLEKISLKAVKAASAVGYITMPKYSKIDFLNGGRAVERMWLAAAKLKISIHPITVPIYLFARLDREHTLSMPAQMHIDLDNARRKFNSLFHIKENQAEIFLFRLFMDGNNVDRSLRKPLNQILHFGE